MTSILSLPTIQRADRFITTEPGVTLHAIEFTPSGKETGLPILCLHGLTRNARDFELVGERLAVLGRRVFALSMRGRGRSSRDANPENYTPLVYVRDVCAVMDALGLGEAVFVGTSMGGVITMLLALQDISRIAGAVLNDIGPRLDPRGLNRIASYVGRGEPVQDWAAAARAARAINAAAFPRLEHDDAFWRTFAQRTYRERPDGRLEPDYDPMIALAFSEPGEAPADITPAFEALSQAPVLVVRGALSDLLAPEGVAHMRALAPDTEFVEIADIGHAPTLEEGAAFDAVVRFLARVP